MASGVSYLFNTQITGDALTDIFTIVQIGHPALRAIAEPVDPAQIHSSEIQTFIERLIATKRAAKGAGIAANQVGSSYRIFVAEAGPNPQYPYRPEYPLTVLINPEVTFLTTDRFECYEGCLSIPELRGVVRRCPKVRVQAYDRDANRVDFEVCGAAASIFQHEMDHLNGILFTDKLTDPETLCSREEFDQRYESRFRRMVLDVEQRYNKQDDE